jgi:hypothetical protein
VGGLIRFLAWFALLVAAFVLVALPLLLSPLLAAMVRDVGLRADTVEVSVALFDPGLIFGRSRQVTLSATNVDVEPARVGRLQLVLGDVELFERSFASVMGELKDVSLALGRDTVDATSVSIEGTADSANATARFSASQVERLVTVAAARNGLALDSVRVSDAGVRVTLRGIEADARLQVRGGALLLVGGPGDAVVLIQPAPSDAWTLTDAWLSDGGLNLAGRIDLERVVRELASETQPG